MPIKLDDGLQLGASGIATQNFTLRTPTPPDGSVALYRGNHGSEGEKVLEVDAQGNVKAKTIHLGTPVAMAGKTFEDFAVPAGVKRVTVMFDRISTNGSSILLVRLGDAGVISSGYRGSATGFTSTTNSILSTNSIVLINNWAAVITMQGVLQLCQLSETVWVSYGVTGRSDEAGTEITGSSVSLTSELTTVRVTTVNGTDQFDAGTANISWEY